MSASIVRGNALRIPLRDASVDLIVTSPPYFSQRSYRDGGEHYAGQMGSEPTPQAFLEALWAVTKECWRVLKPTGSLFVNLGDKRAGSGGHNNSGVSASKGQSSGLQGGKQFSHRAEAREHYVPATRRNAPDRYNQAAFGRPKSKMLLPHRYAIGCEDGQADPEGIGWIVRQDIVWNKPNGLPESVTDRVRDSHEMWFHLVKQGRYFSAVDEIREAHVVELHRPGNKNGAAKAIGPQDRGGHSQWEVASQAKVWGNPLGKLPGSVWSIASEPLVIPEAVKAHYDLPDHFAAFPQEWPRRLILGWSPSGVCTACGDGRRPVVGTRCAKCGALRPNNAKSCPGCGHVRAWKEGRVQEEALGSRDWSTAGHGTPRHPGNHQNRSEQDGYACACPEPTAPTTPSVILDPFGGTGTVAGVARALGRTGVNLDLSMDYCRLAAWILKDGRRFGKAASRTERERQGDLFGAVSASSVAVDMPTGSAL